MPEKDGITVLIENRWIIIAGIVLLLILATFGYIILPLLDGIILGLVFAYVARPIRRELIKRGVGERISSLVATVAIITPLMGILGLGMIEILNQLIMMAKNQQQLVNSTITFINELDIPEPIYQLIQDAVIKLFSSLLLELPASSGCSVKPIFYYSAHVGADSLFDGYKDRPIHTQCYHFGICMLFFANGWLQVRDRLNAYGPWE